MLHDSVKRRNFLQAGTVAGLAAAFAPSAFAAARARYDPAAKFELTVSELEYRINVKGRSLLARVYQPLSSGPFPVVLDLHGGAWNTKDRRAEEPFDRALAGAGALVVAVGIKTKPWRYANGRVVGGGRFGKGAVDTVLSEPSSGILVPIRPETRTNTGRHSDLFGI